MSGTVLNMDMARPYSAVVPTLDGDVLVALAGTTRPLSGRQVAKLVRRGSQKAVSVALERLVEQGIVIREEAGRAYLHVLNRDHLASPAVELLAAMRTELLLRLRQTLTQWSPAAYHASLFGSAARGDGDTDSDVDLLVVRPDDVGDEDGVWRAQLDGLSDAVRAWTGNYAGIVELSESEFRALPAQRAPILHGLRADGIDLAGVPLRRALKACA
jgi:DNA-binding transcriptional ArsR family regulator